MLRAACLLPLIVVGCSLSLGGRTDVCGEYPANGGPAVLATRDQELCEVVRLRVVRQLDLQANLTYDEIDRLLERTAAWEGRPSVDDLVATIRRDAGDAMAGEVRRAVDSVLATSQRPLPADCPDMQRCLVKGAARGVRIALLYAQPHAPAAAPDAKPLSQ